MDLARTRRSLAILAKLEQPIAMSFANETPLEDVLKYIKQATTGPNDPGIPIYVDPLGLQEADKTMTSPVRSTSKVSRCAERSSSCSSSSAWFYFVDDGILVITSQEAEDRRDSIPPGRALAFRQEAREARKRRNELAGDERRLPRN